MSGLVDTIAGGLIVSCQAYQGEPMQHPETMAQVAESVVGGGAVAVRVQGLPDIRLITGRVQVPVVGLWKDGPDEVYITPTLRHALAVVRAGADVVALDGTRRRRPDGLTLEQTIRRLKDDSAIPVLADCACLDDALAARDAGADLVATTLAGHTADRPRTDGPDLGLIAEIVDRLPAVPVIAEGRIQTPEQARQALVAGAHAVVVGTAITHPGRLARRFADGLTAPGTP